MSEQVVPSAAGQHIIVKCLINENVKADEILMRLGTQLDDETLSRTQMHDWSKSRKEGRTEVENMRRLRFQQ
jgi:hypothetical protein